MAIAAFPTATDGCEEVVKAMREQVHAGYDLHDLMGVDGHGVVEQGCVADLLLVHGDPTGDIMRAADRRRPCRRVAQRRHGDGRAALGREAFAQSLAICAGFAWSQTAGMRRT